MSALETKSWRQSHRHVLRSFGPVGLVYGGSIGFLMVGEVLLARYIGPSDFGQYNLVRTALPFVVALALFGYDQALTRETAARGGVPPQFDRRQWSLVALAAVAGAIMALYLCLRLQVFWGTALTLVAAGVAVAVTNLVSGVMRASGRTALGALNQQGYRLFSGLFFVVAASLLTGFRAALILAVASVGVAIGSVVWSSRPRQRWSVTGSEHRLMRRLGFGYSLSMLSLALGDWLDSALIAELARDLTTVGTYGQIKLVALYPLLSVGSILGFIALPVIAARRDSLDRRQVSKWLVGAGVAVLLAAAVMMPVVHVAIRILFQVEVSWVAVALLTVVGALRLYYVLPSAILGATATPRRLAAFGAVGIVGIGTQGLITLCLSHGDLIVAGATGLLAATLIRVIASTLMCIRHTHYGDLSAEITLCKTECKEEV